MTILALTALATILGFVVMAVIVLAVISVMVTILGPWPLIVLIVVAGVAFLFSKPPRSRHNNTKGLP